MRYIRLNNDVKIKWEILRNTDPEVFTNKDITVKLFSKCGCEQPISYTIVDNKIFIDYFGKDQRETGSYRLCLIENDGKKNMATLDYVDCFTLSKTLKNQTSTGSDSSSSLKTEVIELSSKINTTGVEYVGGDGIDVIGSVISVDGTVARTDKLNELEAKVDTKADKTELPDVSIYNPTDNFKTINGESIIGEGDVSIHVPVTSVNGQTGDVSIHVPTNVSELNNDAGYLTTHQDISNLATRDELNNKQNILISGNNLATINGNDLLAGGNIEINSGIEDAPQDGNQYARQNGAWSIVQGGSGDITANGDNNFYGNNTFYNSLNTYGGITISDPRNSDHKDSIFNILTSGYDYEISTNYSTDEVYETGKKIAWSESDNKYIIVEDAGYNIRQISIYNTLNYVSGVTNDYEAFWLNGENIGEGQNILTRIEYNVSPLNQYVYKIFVNVPADFTETVFLECNFNTNMQSYIEGAQFIKDAPFDGNQYARQNGAWSIVQGGSGDITANGDNNFYGNNTFYNQVVINNNLNVTDPRNSNYISTIFDVLSYGHTTQDSSNYTVENVYESGKKIVWSDEQNKAIIVEDANYNIKYTGVYRTINYVYEVTNGYEAFWWDGKYDEEGANKIFKKIEYNTSPSNEYINEVYVNVPVDYTENVYVYFYFDNEYNSYLEYTGFIKDANLDGKKYVRQSGNWTEVEIPNMSNYNPTNNFKTINGNSIIGRGDIVIETGGEGGTSKMDKNHPIFTENSDTTEINPDFRLSGYIGYSSYDGTYNNNCVERYHTSESMYIDWDLSSIKTYLTEHANTKYAAIKGFCRTDGSEYGNCKYYLYLINTNGNETEINQFMPDTHVYGALAESNNITGGYYAIVDSRDPNDNIASVISNILTEHTAYYIRKGVTYYVPYQMYQCDTAFNEQSAYPYFASLIDIKGILENFSSADYTKLRVKIVTDNTDHWHIMSTNLFFTDNTDFTHTVEIRKEYVLIDELNKKAEKNNLKTINGQSIIGTGNIEIQGGSGDITASGDNTFNGTNVFNNPVYIYNSLYRTDPRDSNYTSDIFNVLTDSHTSQTPTYNNIDSVYESGKKLVWSEEQNKAIIVEDANYNIKYCNVYNTINYVYDVTNGYEAFWWNGQYTENGADKILKKVELNTSPSNELVYEFYVNVSADYTADVNIYYYYEAQFQSYLEAYGFLKDAPIDDNQYVRKNGSWTIVQGGSSAVTSVNGQTGAVTIEVPTNVSQLNNDAGYLTEHQDLSNYATKTELSEYNKTENFKTVNGQSIIGTGNIEIQGGSGGGEDKMDKHHPIFNETYAVDEIKPEFRLSGYVDKTETQGTTNYNCVERWHSVDNLWVRWSLENINTYLTNNPNTKFAAVKGFCFPSSQHFGECEYHLFIENTSTGLSEQIDQYMQDRHVYGDYYESKNITLYDNAIVDSRDPNDNIISAVNQAISITSTSRFIRNGVTYYTPDSMSSTNVFFNDNYTLPYMTSIIDIKGILEHYSIDTYTSLRVQMKTTQLTHWHIMSCYLFFSNDTEFMKHSETSVDYVLIDELTQKATKTELNDYNKTNNFKTVNGQSIIGTGNIEIQGGSSAVTSVNGQTGAVTIEVPTNVSQLNNDAGYLTEHQDLSNYATTEFVNNSTNNGHIVWTGTQAEYNALSNKTVYLIYLIKK